MTLKINRYYDLSENGKVYRMKYKGLKPFGYMFKFSDRTNAAFFYGINPLIAANPVLVKIGK